MSAENGIELGVSHKPQTTGGKIGIFSGLGRKNNMLLRGVKINFQDSSARKVANEGETGKD